MRLRIEQTTPLTEKQERILGQLRAAPSPIRGGWRRGDWLWQFYITTVVVTVNGKIFLECWERHIEPGMYHNREYSHVGHITPHDHVLEGVDQ